MPYLDGLPTASSASLGDYVAVAQGGTTDRPGTATMRKATLEQIFEGIGITGLFASPPPIGSTTPNTGKFTHLNFPSTAAFSGTAFSGGLIYEQATWTGSNSGTDRTPFNTLYAYDQVDAGYGAGGGTNTLYLGHNINSASHKGAATALEVVIGLTAQSGNAGSGFPYTSYNAAKFQGLGVVNDGGTALNPQSSMFGAEIASDISAGYWIQGVGLEVGYGLASGASAQDVIGMQIVAHSTHATLGTVDSIALAFANQSADAPVETYLAFGRTYAQPPSGANVTLIRSINTNNTGTYSVKTLMDFRQSVPTDYILRASTMFITAAGGISARNSSFGSASGPIIVAGDLSDGGATIYADTSTGGADVDLYLHPKGIGKVYTTAAMLVKAGAAANYLQFAGAATGNAPGLFAQGSDTDVSMSVNAQGTGGSVKVNTNNGATQVFQFSQVASNNGYVIALGGNSAASPMQFFGSGTGNNILIGGTSTGTGVIATNATTGMPMVPRMAGTPSGTVVNNTLGAAIVGDTTASRIWMNFGGTWRGVATAASGSEPYLPSAGGTVTGTVTVYGLLVQSTAANLVQIAPAATGNSPGVYAQGSDTNVPLIISGQGTGSQKFFSGSTQTFETALVTSADGYVTSVAGIAASKPHQFYANGTANNILIGGPLGGGGKTTTDTTGFLMVPVMAGKPTGVVVNNGQGAAVVVDVTNHKFCWNEAGTWYGVTGAAL